MILCEVINGCSLSTQSTTGSKRSRTEAIPEIWYPDARSCDHECVSQQDTFAQTNPKSTTNGQTFDKTSSRSLKLTS